MGDHRISRFVVVIALLATAACTAARHETPAGAVTPGCTSANGHDPGESIQTIRSSGTDRTYTLYVPPGYTGHDRVPVVFTWHGFGSSAQAQLSYTGIETLAQKEGFLVVAPQGQGTPPHFNLTPVPPPNETDDVIFAEDMVSDVTRHLCADSKRIFATGMSNGGAMAAVLACRASQQFAAFGSVAAVVWAPSCDVARPVPLIAFHGTADPIVPFDGGTVSCCGNPHIDSVASTMGSWAGHDRCTAAPTEQRVAAHIVHRVWSGCRPPGSVELYVIEGGGHTWPGSGFKTSLGTTTDEINATALSWAFFKQHPLP